MYSPLQSTQKLFVHRPLKELDPLLVEIALGRLELPRDVESIPPTDLSRVVRDIQRALSLRTRIDVSPTGQIDETTVQAVRIVESRDLNRWQPLGRIDSDVVQRLFTDQREYAALRLLASIRLGRRYPLAPRPLYGADLVEQHAVELVKEQLEILGHLSSPSVSGQYGSGFVTALRAFQSSAQIPVTGVVDARTVEQLFPPPVRAVNPPRLQIAPWAGSDLHQLTQPEMQVIAKFLPALTVQTAEELAHRLAAFDALLAHFNGRDRDPAAADIYALGTFHKIVIDSWEQADVFVATLRRFRDSVLRPLQQYARTHSPEEVVGEAGRIQLALARLYGAPLPLRLDSPRSIPAVEAPSAGNVSLPAVPYSPSLLAAGFTINRIGEAKMAVVRQELEGFLENLEEAEAREFCRRLKLWFDSISNIAKVNDSTVNQRKLVAQQEILHFFTTNPEDSSKSLSNMMSGLAKISRAVLDWRLAVTNGLPVEEVQLRYEHVIQTLYNTYPGSFDRHLPPQRLTYFAQWAEQLYREATKHSPLGMLSPEAQESWFHAVLAIHNRLASR